MNTPIITACIYLSFYVISGYSTTDIIRLSNGSKANISDSNCFCPVCGKKIRLPYQIPILSYFICKGKCHNCNSRIPKTELYLEVIVFTVLSASSTLMRFSLNAYFLSLLLYESIKVTFLFTHGTREAEFGKNLICSLLNNIVLWVFIAFLFGLRAIV